MMLEMARWMDVVLGLLWYRIVWVSGQFCQFPPDVRWSGDRCALNQRMGRLMFYAIGLCLVAAASLSASVVAARSFPSLRPWVYGATGLMLLLLWPFWREVARLRAEVVRLRQ